MPPRARHGRSFGGIGLSAGKPRPANRLLRALADTARALEALPARSMIIGGLAVIAHGVARTTRDIDVALAGGPHIIDPSLSVLRKQGVVPRIDDAAQFAAEAGVLLLVHRASGVEIDISLASLRFEEEALSTAERRRLAGVFVRLARPEDLVVYKAAAWRPQDRQDIERLVALHGPHMKLDRVRALAREIFAVLETPERRGELDDLLRGAQSRGRR